jgi:urate oxidase
LTFRLADSSYGKADVRLVKVTRTPGRHELLDLTVDVALGGDFEAAHTRGDNAALLATDTMRNTVYALAGRHAVTDVEVFGRILVEHFLQAGPTVERARVHIVQRPWSRIGDHEHAFHRAGGGHRLATVSGDGEVVSIDGGIDELEVLKTTGSGWEGFLRDEYTTLPETADRILATAVTARWSYAEGGIDYTDTWRRARDAILDAFGDHYSPSVQFTLYRLGEAVLAACPEIARVHLSLPNRHHILYDLARFGLENPNEIFHASAEPHGLIEGTVERR